MTGWIKLHRCLLEWEWYDDINTKVLFIHLLLKANYEDKQWRGKTIKRGDFITSLEVLSRETNLSIQTIRTCLSKLEKTGEINKQSNKQFTLVTINKYDDYNDINTSVNTQPNKQLTNDQQTINKQLTTTKEVKKERSKEYKNILLSEIEISDVHIKSEFVEIAKSFQLLFKKNLEEAGAATSIIDKAKGTWIDDIRLMIESDGYTLADLRDAYQFLQKDSFWKQNILSTKKLREKMPQLKLKMHNNGKTGKPNKEGTSWDELAQIIHKHTNQDE